MFLHGVNVVNSLEFSIPVAQAQDTRTIKEKVVDEIIKQANAQGYPSKRAITIASCESGFNPDAKNKYSTASGVFQFIKSTWLSTESGKAGISPFDYKANIKEAITLLANGGESHWTASMSCWA